MPYSISHSPALEGRTLLDELNHRIKNEPASVINLVSFKAIWAKLAKLVACVDERVAIPFGASVLPRGAGLLAERNLPALADFRSLTTL